MTNAKDVLMKGNQPAAKPQPKQKVKTVDKDAEFIADHKKLLKAIKSISNNRVFCLKGFVTSETSVFKLGTTVWFIGPAKDEEGFKAFFIGGKNRNNKWTNAKFVARNENELQLKYIDVPKGFAVNNGLYNLTKDQLIQLLQNSIDLRVSQVNEKDGKRSTRH